jgi:hypothetical protein
MKTKTLLCLAMMTGATTASLAGMSASVAPVYLSIPSNTTIDASAQGNLTDARQSADGVQFIGCTLTGYRNGIGNGVVYCFARNAAGQSASCYTREVSPYMASAVAAMGPHTNLQFYWFQSSGECRSVSVTASSDRLPAATAVAQ